MTAVERLAQLDGDSARRFHHLPGLDGVRAFAVIFVIGLHYGSLWLDKRPGGLVPGGYIGVDIFFVLSGFLITSLLVGEQSAVGAVSFTKFYARRALRLLPALYAVLVAHALYTVWIGESLVTEAKQVASVVLYVSNFAQVYVLKSMINSGIGFTWSLAIEEQFYLVWPALLVLGVLRFARTRATVFWLIGGGAVLSLVIRVLVWNIGEGYPAAYMRPDCRADGLLIGAFCAFVWRWDLVPRRYLNQAALVSAAFLVLMLNVKSGDFTFNIGFFLVSVAAGVVILAVAEGTSALQPLMEWAPLRQIGKVSYGLYLWHTLGLRVAIKAFDPGNKVVAAVLGLLLMSIAVTLSWRLIEQPFLKLKKRVASPVSH